MFFCICVMDSICAQCPSGYCCIHTSWALLLIWSLHLLNSSCQNLFQHPLLICLDGDGSNHHYAHAETFIAQNWSSGSSVFWRPHVTSNKDLRRFLIHILIKRWKSWWASKKIQSESDHSMSYLCPVAETFICSLGKCGSEFAPEELWEQSI